jgi:hypothetical protein
MLRFGISEGRLRFGITEGGWLPQLSRCHTGRYPFFYWWLPRPGRSDLVGRGIFFLHTQWLNKKTAGECQKPHDGARPQRIVHK